METTQHSSFNLASIGLLILAIAIAGGLYWNKTRLINVRFDRADQRADSLFLAKLQLEGDNRSLASQLETATDENAYSNRRLASLHRQLSRSEEAANKLHRIKSDQTRSVQSLHHDIDSLARQGDSLTNQMEAMQDKIDWLMKANNLLISQNKELQKKVSDLNTSLATKVARPIITGDAFLVEAIKVNRKATAKAKKTHSLTISFSLPAEIDMEKTQEIYLSLTNEQHKAMIAPLRTTTITLPDVNEIIPVHAAQTVNFGRKPQRISFSINPETAIKPGIYRASVYTKDTYLGSVEFQLRDSFLFF